MSREESIRDGKPQNGGGRPSSTARTDPGSDRSGERPMAESRRQDYRGDGPGKMGLTSDAQPDLVSPSGVNERDHGAADDKPMGGGALDFDDGDMAHPRGRTTGAGRTWDEKTPSDAGRLGAPNVGMSNHNGPSDPDAKRNR